jgi:hypothetical protein
VVKDIKDVDGGSFVPERGQEKRMGFFEFNRRSLAGGIINLSSRRMNE